MIIHHTPALPDYAIRPPVRLHSGLYVPLLTREEVDTYHRAHGYERVGYHYLVEPDGAVRIGRCGTGAHCHGHQRERGIAICGAFDRDHRPPDAQWRALVRLCADICQSGDLDPIRGHCEVSETACPGIDMDLLRAEVDAEVQWRISQ